MQPVYFIHRDRLGLHSGVCMASASTAQLSRNVDTSSAACVKFGRLSDPACDRLNITMSKACCMQSVGEKAQLQYASGRLHTELEIPILLYKSIN